MKPECPIHSCLARADTLTVIWFSHAFTVNFFFQAQELKVKKQFHETCKIQERQYKMLRKQMLANAPRENHREIIQKFKEDRMRKFADLGLQYDQSINDLLQKQKV